MQSSQNQKSNNHYFDASPTKLGETKKVTFSFDATDFSVQSASGVFSTRGLDKGTRILLHFLEKNPDLLEDLNSSEKTLLDLGCGWGPISIALASRCPRSQVIGVDINPNAVTLCNENAQSNGFENVQAKTPADLPGELKVHGIWSNPPIRIGKQALQELLVEYLNRLHPGGQAFLVVNKNLGADSLTKWINTNPAFLGQCHKVASSQGFRVLRYQN